VLYDRHGFYHHDRRPGTGRCVVCFSRGSRSSSVFQVARKTSGNLSRNTCSSRLQECSRWPEREDCGQECLKQIEADPQNCRVWNIVDKWYDGKKCVFCRKPIGPLHHLDHVPALLGPDFKTCEWKDVAPEDLPRVCSTHHPVCWNCHVAETFRRVHPNLVTDRAFEPRRTM